MLSTFNALFPLWAVIASILAYCFPYLLVPLKSIIIVLLSIVMFFMGLTLTASDFKRVLVLPQELAVGLIVVGCCAGGTASNVICYLAKGELALSISMTLFSSFLGVLLTPLFCSVYISKNISVDYLSMLLSITQMVLVPLMLGLIINHYFHLRVRGVECYLPSLSIVFIILIVAIIVALNEARLAQVGLVTLIAVCLHNGVGMLLGFWCGRWLGLPVKTCRTISIEVGMQNSGLGVALAMKYFSVGAALPGAVFSIWHNIAGSTVAGIWRRNPVADADSINVSTT